MKTFRLTTDHASSSYGLPVMVGQDGNAYGPADQLPWIDEEGVNHGLHPMLGGMTAGWLARQMLDDPDSSQSTKDAAHAFLSQSPNA